MFDTGRRRPWFGRFGACVYALRHAEWVYLKVRSPELPYEYTVAGWPLKEFKRMSEKKKESIGRSLVEKLLSSAAKALTPEDPQDDSLCSPYPNLGAILSTSMTNGDGQPEYARLVVRYDKIATMWSVELQVTAKHVKCCVVCDQYDQLLATLDRALALPNPPWQPLPVWGKPPKKRKN